MAARWSSLIYFSPAAPGEVQGTIYRIPALGGPRQRVIAASAAATSAATGRLACFRLEHDASSSSPPRSMARTFRWLTDARDPALSVSAMVARQRSGSRFRRATDFDGTSTSSLPAAASRTGAAHDDNRLIEGLAWLPDGSGIVFAPEPRQHHSRTCRRWRCGKCGWTAAAAAATHASRSVLRAARCPRQRPRLRHPPADAVRFWSFPFGASPRDNVRSAVTVTRQTGQVLTPTAAPDGDRSPISPTAAVTPISG